MSSIYGTAIIRDRGQLTIPEKIRVALKWSFPNSVVSLVTTSENELLIKPFEGKKQTDWANIWRNIALSRSYEGTRGNLSGFIIADREAH